MTKFDEWLKSEKPILIDGAMGTMLMEYGLEPGDLPEEWNISHSEEVRKIHQDYIQAGSQIILTNSFGGTSYRLQTHNLQDRVLELNKAAAENARIEADQAPDTVLVAGSMGPTGQLFEPMGTLTFDDARDAFADQAAGLVEGGVDLFWIETMSDLQEVKAAVEGIRSVSELPIVATMSFDTHGHTMMGVSPQKAVEELLTLDLKVIGANCGTGSDELIEVIKTMSDIDLDVALVAKANAGLPQVVDGNVVYNGSPEVMANYAREVYQAGARLIGGCCGNTPAHIQAMAAALANPDR
jgi:5-methyltetrahydrofolate--homocysteine methyltransferase